MANRQKPPTELVGGVSIGLGPPRSLISLKRTTFTCDVIIRDFHLIDYALDIPAMCLDNKAKYDLNNLPWNKMKFLGGNIAFHAPRHKENNTINATKLSYSDGGPNLNNVDRKIMWKMYDRERDYNWVFDSGVRSASALKTVTSRDTVKLTDISDLLEGDDDNRKQRLGLEDSTWSTLNNKKVFPQLIKLSTDHGTNNFTQTQGDRLYESMNDHALSSGSLEFPMVGWPYFLRNPYRELCFNDLKVAATLRSLKHNSL